MVSQILKESGDLFLVLGVCGVVLLMILPIPPIILDLLLVVSISVALLIILVAFYTEKPLDFSAFPTMLLFATLLRLTLNVASTRLILTNGGSGEAAAGEVIRAFGAFVAGESDLIETLIQRARTYIYTTALPPAVAEATRASLRIVQEEPWRRAHLQALVDRFRRGAQGLGFASLGTATGTSLCRSFMLLESTTPIQSLVLGLAEAALAASRSLRAAGFLVPAIRPPTVPEGSARLRITFSATHTEAQVDRLLDALAALKPQP